MLPVDCYVLLADVVFGWWKYIFHYFCLGSDLFL